MQSPRSPLCFVNRFVSFKRDWAKYYPSECFLIPRDDNYKKGHKNIWLRGFLTNEILFLLSKEIVCCWKRLLSTRPELPRTQNPVNCELPRAQDWTESNSQMSHLRASQANTNVKSACKEESAFWLIWVLSVWICVRFAHSERILSTLSSKGNISAPRNLTR